MQRIKDRITVVETVYHQPYGRNPRAIESKFSRELETTEQLYERHLQVTEEWQSLDCGWLKDNAGMFVIQNDEGHFNSFNPSDAERALVAKKTVEIAYENPNSCRWLIPPGESMRARPSHACSLLIRCQSGNAEITLFVFPR